MSSDFAIFVDFSFYWELAFKAWNSALASMSSSILAILFPIAYGIYRLCLSYQREGWLGVKKNFISDSRHALIFGSIWWALLFSYHVFVKVPKEIRNEAENITAPSFVSHPPHSAYSKSTPALTITAWTPVKQPVLEQPGFTEKPDQIMFVIGGSVSGFHFKLMRENQEFFPLTIDGFNLITARLNHGKLLFALSVWSSSGESPIEVKDNEFTVRTPPGWDRNSNTNAIEVVNAQGRPVFQMIRKTQTEIDISGIFPMPNGKVAIAKPGQFGVVSPDLIGDFSIDPIFELIAT